MGEVVNLNKFRKARSKIEAARQASENRTRFGRTKAEKNKGELEQSREAQELDGKRLE